jgi:two-component system, NarL family, response regulator NreC
MKPRVVLADDHQLVAEGLVRLISEKADIVANVNNGLDLVEIVTRLHPDIVVSDVSMPQLSGIQALRQLVAAGSKARFIFLTVHSDGDLAAEAIRAGAKGFVPKQAAGEEFFDAMNAVLAGRTYISPRITGEVLASFRASPAGPKLTVRQREVLSLVCDGHKMKKIAAELDLSVRTVEDHKAQLMHALGATSTAELVKIAIRRGLVEN